MLGVQLLGNEKLTVKEYPEPILTYKNDLLIQVKASGICGSEMHGYRSPTPHTSNGGHEVAGEVIDAGQINKIQGGRPRWHSRRLGVRGLSVVWGWKIYLLQKPHRSRFGNTCGTVRCPRPCLSQAA